MNERNEKEELRSLSLSFERTESFVRRRAHARNHQKQMCSMRCFSLIFAALMVLALARGSLCVDSPPNAGVNMADVSPDAQVVAAVVVLCYKRARYLERNLASLRRRWEQDRDVCESRGQTRASCAARFPIFVSQDGHMSSVAKVAQRVCGEHDSRQKTRPNDDDDNNTNSTAHSGEFGCEHIQWSRGSATDLPNVYHYISRHYYRILQELFDRRGFERVLILEDDMELSVDFFEYFAAMAPILDADGTLLCASSWNDNGQAKHVDAHHTADVLLRSDFFPGLGWMLTRHVWRTLAPQWPDAYWDDWLRSPEIRRGTSISSTGSCMCVQSIAKHASNE